MPSNRDRIVARVVEASGLAPKQARWIVELTFKSIIDALKRERHVRLREFGRFDVINVLARPAQSMKTGTTMTLPPHLAADRRTISNTANAGAINYTYDAMGNRLTPTSTAANVPTQTQGYDDNDGDGH